VEVDERMLVVPAILESPRGRSLSARFEDFQAAKRRTLEAEELPFGLTRGKRLRALQIVFEVAQQVI
jgi:hypothetical protein